MEFQIFNLDSFDFLKHLKLKFIVFVLSSTVVNNTKKHVKMCDHTE